MQNVESPLSPSVCARNLWRNATAKLLSREYKWTPRPDPNYPDRFKRFKVGYPYTEEGKQVFRIDDADKDRWADDGGPVHETYT